MERKNAWKEYTEAEVSELEKLNESYRKFLDAGKTERECVKQAVAMAEAAGYLDLKKVIKEGKQVKAGDKLYAVNMKKSLALFQIGKQPLEKGMAILGAHIDSPRLDIKQNPLYEDTELAYLDTHYYGGIKKYQWVTLPLAIHGVIAKNDGTIVDVTDTPMDFRKPRCVGDDIDSDYPPIVLAGGYDHNYVLDKPEGTFAKVAEVTEKESGRTMEVYTDLPGMQLYSGNFIENEKGKDGQTYTKRTGICFETQFFPNSINVKSFTPCVIKAGETFESETMYKFIF